MLLMVEKEQMDAAWDYQTHYACRKQCLKYVFATENPSFVAENRVGRVVNFIKCSPGQRQH
jgi:hypothetical protein